MCVLVSVLLSLSLPSLPSLSPFPLSLCPLLPPSLAPSISSFYPLFPLSLPSLPSLSPSVPCSLHPSLPLTLPSIPCSLYPFPLSLTPSSYEPHSVLPCHQRSGEAETLFLSHASDQQWYRRRRQIFPHCGELHIATHSQHMSTCINSVKCCTHVSMSCPRVSILLNVVHMYQYRVHVYQFC